VGLFTEIYAEKVYAAEMGNPEWFVEEEVIEYRF